jgi:hypothetical protein
MADAGGGTPGDENDGGGEKKMSKKELNKLAKQEKKAMKKLEVREELMDNRGGESDGEFWKVSSFFIFARL